MELDNDHGALLDKMSDLLNKERKLMELRVLAKEKELEEWKRKYESSQTTKNDHSNQNKLFSLNSQRSQAFLPIRKCITGLDSEVITGSMRNTTHISLSNTHVTLLHLRQLVKNMKHLSRLRSLSMHNCELDDHATELIGEILLPSCKIRCLDISKNNFKEIAGKLILNEISNNITLTSLDISDNPFSKNSLINSQLITALAKNSTLIHISLTLNSSSSDKKENVDTLKKKPGAPAAKGKTTSSTTVKGAVNISNLLNTNKSLQSIGFFGFLLPPEIIQSLGTIIANLTSLDLSFCFIGTKGALHIAEALKGEVPTKTNSKEKIGNKKAPVAVPTSPKKGVAKGSVKQLETSNKKAKPLNKLISLNLRSNGVSSFAAIELLNSLKQNITSLTYLNLSSNDLEDSFLDALGNYLENSSTTLTHCDIGRNNYSDESIATFQRLVKNNTNILSLGDSFLSQISLNSRRILQSRLQENNVYPCSTQLDTEGFIPLKNKLIMKTPVLNDETAVSTNGFDAVEMFRGALNSDIPSNSRLFIRWKAKIDPGKYNFKWIVARKNHDLEEIISFGNFDQGLDDEQEARASFFRQFCVCTSDWNPSNEIVIYMEPIGNKEEKDIKSKKILQNSFWISGLEVFLDERNMFGVIYNDSSLLSTPSAGTINNFIEHRKVYINTTSNSKINVQWKSKIQKTNHLEIYTSDDTYSWRISRTRFGCSENVVAFGDFYENLLAGELPSSFEMKLFSVDTMGWNAGDSLIFSLRYNGKCKSYKIISQGLKLTKCGNVIGSSCLKQDEMLLYSSSLPFERSQKTSINDIASFEDLKAKIFKMERGLSFPEKRAMEKGLSFPEKRAISVQKRPAPLVKTSSLSGDDNPKLEKSFLRALMTPKGTVSPTTTPSDRIASGPFRFDVHKANIGNGDPYEVRKSWTHNHNQDRLRDNNSPMAHHGKLPFTGNQILKATMSEERLSKIEDKNWKSNKRVSITATEETTSDFDPPPKSTVSTASTIEDSSRNFSMRSKSEDRESLDFDDLAKSSSFDGDSQKEGSDQFPNLSILSNFSPLSSTTTFSPKAEEIKIERGEADIQRQITQLSSLVPERIIKHIINTDNTADVEVRAEKYSASVLFADISGFSLLAEKLLKDNENNARAAEDLSHIINKSLSKMVDTICRKRGDVIKFAGDAILAVFADDLFNKDLRASLVCCSRVALELVNLDLSSSGANLSIHCGIGCGDLIGYNVGGVGNRWEYVITGNPVDQIGSAEPEAAAGEVVLSNPAYLLLNDMAIGDLLPSTNFRLTTMTDEDKTILYEDNTIRSVLSKLETKVARHVHANLRGYVSRPVLASIDSMEQSLWIAELRVATTLFIKILGLKYEIPDQVQELQKVVVAIEEQIQKYDGTLCRFIVDDKGSGFLVAFGLPPAMHEKDPLRAVKMAMGTCTSISTLGKIASIGITSGRVFCGTTGGDLRCEYTLHGTLVNLSARLMVASKGGVLVNETTWEETKSEIHYEEKKMIKVKGKSNEIAVYRPTQGHHGREQESQILDGHSKLVGREHELSVLDRKFRSLISDKPKGGVLLFEGAPGVGKTRICSWVKSKAPIYGIEILSGNGLDTECSTPFYAWRNIFLQLCGIKEDFASGEFFVAIKSCLSDDLFEFIPFFSQMFPGKIQLTNDFQQNRTAESRIDSLIHVCVSVIEFRVKYLLAEPDVVTAIHNGSPNSGNLHRSVSLINLNSSNPVVPLSNARRQSVKAANQLGIGMKLRKPSTKKAVTPSRKASKLLGFVEEKEKDSKDSGEIEQTRVLISLDDTNYMDANSWNLLIEMASKVNPILFVLTIREKNLFSHQYQRLDTMQKINSITLQNLFRHDTTTLIEFVLSKQIKEVTKNPQKITSISEKVVETIMSRSQGHPLFTEELTKMIFEKKGFTVSSEGVATLSPEMEKGSIGLPDNVSALMTTKIDSLNRSEQLLIKVGSVIGMKFLKDTLWEVFPGDRPEKPEALDEDLRSLCAKGYITQLNVLEYQFNQTLMRDASYDSILYTLRRDIHLRIAKHFEKKADPEFMHPFYTALANHYYHAEDWDKAIFYLSKDGDSSLDNHAMQQAMVCFSRLVAMDNELTDHVTSIERASWNRKLGSACLSEGNFDVSEYYFMKALNMLGHKVPTTGCAKWFNTFYLKYSRPRKGGNSLLSKEEQLNYLEAVRSYENLAIIYKYNTSESYMWLLYALRLSQAVWTEIEKCPPELSRAEANMAIHYSSRVLHHKARALKLVTKSLQGAEKTDHSETKTEVYYKSAYVFTGYCMFKEAKLWLGKAEWITKFLKFIKKRSDVLILMGTIYWLEGHFEKSIDSWKECWKADETVFINYGYASATLLIEDSVKAFILVETALKLQKGKLASLRCGEVAKLLPESLSAYSVWSFLCIKKTDYVTALGVVTLAIEYLDKTYLVPTLTDFQDIYSLYMITLTLLGYSHIEMEDDKNLERKEIQQANYLASYLLNIIKEFCKFYICCEAHFHYCEGIRLQNQGNTSSAIKKYKKCLARVDFSKISYIKGMSHFQIARCSGDINEKTSNLNLALKIVSECGAVAEVKAIKKLLESL